MIESNKRIAINSVIKQAQDQLAIDKRLQANKNAIQANYR